LGVSVLRGRSRGRESTQGSLHRHDRYVQDCATTTIVRYGSGRLARTAWNVSLVRIIGRLRRFVESFTRTIPIQRSIVNGHVDDVKTEYSHDHVPIHESLLGYCSPGPRSAHGRTRDGCFPNRDPEALSTPFRMLLRSMSNMWRSNGRMVRAGWTHSER